MTVREFDNLASVEWGDPQRQLAPGWMTRVRQQLLEGEIRAIEQRMLDGQTNFTPDDAYAVTAFYTEIPYGVQKGRDATLEEWFMDQRSVPTVPIGANCRGQTKAQ